MNYLNQLNVNFKKIFDTSTEKNDNPMREIYLTIITITLSLNLYSHKEIYKFGQYLHKDIHYSS